MPTWDERVRRSWRIPAIAGAGRPLSTHLLRDAALGLNCIKAYVSRPTLVNQQLEAGYAGTAYLARGGSSPGVVIAAWRSGSGPIAPGYERLRGSLYGALMSGVGVATEARFRVWSDLRPYADATGFSPYVQASADLVFTVLDTRDFKAFNLPLVCDNYGQTWIAVTAWTDGPSGQGNEPRAQLFGLQAYASIA